MAVPPGWIHHPSPHGNAVGRRNETGVFQGDVLKKASQGSRKASSLEPYTPSLPLLSSDVVRLMTKLR
jgi:hypothetical protein